ncbi:MAG: hypothetical protein O7B25_13610, partial [Gammaproteobacteria bacterium]|nr:hypothetical protein [Gammaproteobacteria bacterium]
MESRLVLKRSDNALDGTLILDGQDLELVSVAVDGAVLGSNEYQLNANSLTLLNLPESCEVA